MHGFCDLSAIKWQINFTVFSLQWQTHIMDEDVMGRQHQTLTLVEAMKKGGK